MTLPEQTKSHSDIFSRYKWSKDAISNYQTKELRRLLYYCKEHSPWYSRHLQSLPIETITSDDLSLLPILTKKELISNWNEIVTDPKLKLENVVSYLEKKTSLNSAFDNYHFWYTGGTSGQKGVIVWSKSDFTLYRQTVYRSTIASLPTPPPSKIRLSTIVARYPIHMSYLLWNYSFTPNITISQLDINDSIPVLTNHLAEHQPNVIVSYPSILAGIARYCKMENILLSPSRIILTAEPVIESDKTVIQSTWNDSVISNFYGSTEGGPFAMECHLGHHQHLFSDSTILEPVNAMNHSVPNGTLSDDLLITNLLNYTLPIIRFKIGDKIQFSSKQCLCGSNYPILDKIEGRKFPSFSYGGIDVPTSNIYFMAIAHPQVLSMQGIQTTNGINITLYTSSDFNTAELLTEITQYFINNSIPSPQITLTLSHTLNRHSDSGKLTYFKPL